MAHIHKLNPYSTWIRKKNVNVGGGSLSSTCAPGFCGCVWFHSGLKHKHTRSVRRQRAVNMSCSDSVCPTIISDSSLLWLRSVFWVLHFHSKSIKPTVLPTVHYSPQSAFLSVNVNWIMQLLFSLPHLLLCLTCGFILLSVALFVLWHINKKRKTFFYLCKGTKCF